MLSELTAIVSEGGRGKGEAKGFSKGWLLGCSLISKKNKAQPLKLTRNYCPLSIIDLFKSNGMNM